MIAAGRRLQGAGSVTAAPGPNSVGAGPNAINAANGLPVVGLLDALSATGLPAPLPTGRFLMHDVDIGGTMHTCLGCRHVSLSVTVL